MTKKTIYIFGFIAISIYLVFTIINSKEQSTLAKIVDSANFSKLPLTNIFQGKWSIACPLSETSRPIIVINEVGVSGLRFSPSGNNNREMLLDGETGILLIDEKSSIYSLFLLFDHNKMSVLATRSKSKFQPCFDFENSNLVLNRSFSEGWKEFALEDLN